MEFNYILLIFSVLFVGALSQHNETHREFPPNFLFGVATASYQVEGAWNESGKGENIWDYLTHNTNLVDDLSSGDVACDSYNLYPRDIEMMKELGVDYYRFSISWTRILPTSFDNIISTDGIDYYNRLIDLLIENDIRPVVTLYHWDLPQALQTIGGWPNERIAKYYVDYTRVAFEAFGDRVKDWLTFNEPFEICQSGYGLTAKAPALNYQGVANYLCAHTLLKAHAGAYRLYDEVFKPTQKGRVGLTMNAGWHEPENPESEDDLEASDRAMQFSLGWFAHPIVRGDYPEVVKERVALRSQQQGFSYSRLPNFTSEEVDYIRGTYDFIGLNHYTSSMVRANNGSVTFPVPSYSDDLGVYDYQDPAWSGSPVAGWLKVVPWGFTKLLVWMKDNLNDPEIIIMENGFSDWGGLIDVDRLNYYHHYMNALLDAMEQGVNVTAYTAWSLLDNFEWMSGYTEKFGLYDVDFNDPARPRVAKLSASFFRDVVTTKSIPIVSEHAQLSSTYLSRNALDDE